MKKLTFKDGTGMKVTVDTMEDLRRGIAELVRSEVLVGVPGDNTDRDDPASAAAGITNAALAYIHDNGAPEAGIPARPFMIPGVQKVRDRVTVTLEKMARYTFSNQPGLASQGLDRVGFLCVDSITSTIRAGIPPPLAEYTLKQRAAKGRKGAQAELNRRAAGYGASLQLATPLMDTNEMLKSITYVIRPRNWRRSP